MTRPRPDDNLTLEANGKAFTGWETIRISRSIEGAPADFDIGLSERYPGSSQMMDLKAGMACTIKLGNDIALKGWIDRVILSYSVSSHRVQILGRSLLEDLVDCSIDPEAITGMSIFQTNLLELAKALAKIFNIPVAAAPNLDLIIASQTGQSIPIDAVLTETGWEVIERVARYVGVLVYDKPDGSLFFASVAQDKMQSGFAHANVQAASVGYAMDQRFSVYLPALMSKKYFDQVGASSIPLKPAYDQGVKRTRPRIIVSEQFTVDGTLAEKRAVWEAARRFGRSQAVSLTCDNWRDEAGALWTINATAPIDLPVLKLKPAADWVISSVSFIRDLQRGTVADLVMMPREAFTIEPTILIPFLNDPTEKPGPAGAAP